MDRIGKQEIRWAWVILLLGLVVLLFMTLPPLAVDLSTVGWYGRFDLRLIKTDNLTDWVRNIVLFIPFGFGLSALFGRERPALSLSKWPFLNTLLLTTLFGFLLSLSIEIYQALNPYREPALADVAANTLGAAVGSGLFLLAGQFILHSLVLLTGGTRRFMQQHKVAAGLVLLILFIGYLGLVWQGIYTLQQQVSLANWDMRVPLSLGNVKTGELPWAGTVSELLLADEALDVTAVSALLAGTPIEDLIDETTNTTRATFPDNPVLIDHAGKNITFNRIEEFGASWLLTDDIIGWWAEDMRMADQFTIGLQLAAATANQTESGRILAMTHYPFVSNISLEQQGTDLIILLRTVLAGENDKRPEWVLPNFFEDTNPHFVVLTFDGQSLNLYRDASNESWQIPYTADIIYYRYLHPIPRWRVQVGFSLWLYRLLFYLLTAVPLGLFWGAFVALWPRRWLQVLMLVLGVILVGGFLETALILPRADLRWGRVLLGTGVTAVTAIWTIRQMSRWLLSTAPVG